MEIKKETLVVILEEGTTDFPLGVVILGIVSGEPAKYLIRTKSGKEVELPEEKLFPLCQGVSQTTNFDTSEIIVKLPQIVRNFALEIDSLKKQIQWLADNKATKGSG